MASIRKQLHRQLDTAAWRGKGLSPFNQFVFALVLASIVIVVIETEPAVYGPFSNLFDTVDLVLAVIFSLEYVIRLWTIGERPEFAGILGRVRYAVTPMALVDLLAILPFFVGLLGSDAFLLRTFRLVRILSLAKLGRYSDALRRLGAATANRRFELVVSLCVAALVLLFSATMMYLVEGGTQPEAFGSIPRAMWWGIATLTTIGYGDVYPVTVFGKMFAGLTAIAAIGMLAMPTGILAAAFAEAFKSSTADE